MLLIEALKQSILSASAYNSADQVAPAAILWSDAASQWTPVIELLRAEDLTILTLGPYNAEASTGPPIWIRCSILTSVAPNATPPIVYLPGKSRTDLIPADDIADELKPLLELQYRGAFFCQPNGQDWTIASFLASSHCGGIEVSSDDATADALRLGIETLATEQLSRLQAAAPLRARSIQMLLVPDPAKELLSWMNRTSDAAQPPSVSWHQFRSVCKDQYNFDPDVDGPLTAARNLGSREGPWDHVWNRFAEAPSRYPKIAELLRQARPTEQGLFQVRESWPQNNDEAEADVRSSLSQLRGAAPQAAREAVARLERENCERRGWVWAELGQSPLANALEPLAQLAEHTKVPLSGRTPQEIAQKYVADGWKADAAALRGMAAVSAATDIAAVKSVVEALYRPWLTASVENFQDTVKSQPLPRLEPIFGPDRLQDGKCILFSDGLRMDVAQQLCNRLSQSGLATSLTFRFGALRGVTATAKPAVSPAASVFGPGPGLAAAVVDGGQEVTAATLRREVERQGYRVLTEDETGDPNGLAWTEHGSIDSHGHDEQWKICRRVDEEIQALSARISALLDAGWGEVIVITDHGWLLLPGGLPNVELPQHLTQIRKHRCARMGDGAGAVPYMSVPWQWDSNVAITMAPGISTFVAGTEYDHGGLSPQECIIPMIAVKKATAASRVAITTLRWQGLRCRITVQGAPANSIVDLRVRAAAANTSIAIDPVAVQGSGEAALVVKEVDLEERIGIPALVVVVSSEGAILAQKSTITGGDEDG